MTSQIIGSLRSIETLFGQPGIIALTILLLTHVRVRTIMHQSARFVNNTPNKWRVLCEFPCLNLFLNSPRPTSLTIPLSQRPPLYLSASAHVCISICANANNWLPTNDTHTHVIIYTFPRVSRITVFCVIFSRPVLLYIRSTVCGTSHACSMPLVNTTNKNRLHISFINTSNTQYIQYKK